MARDWDAEIDHEAAEGCAECDGTGLSYEWCGCFQCEYENHHGGDIPCAECQGALYERLDREAYEAGQ